MKLLPTNQPVNLRYTDLTAGAEAWLGEAWVMPGIYQGTEGVWNPCVISRRRGAAMLASTFIAVLEPFAETNSIGKIRRLAFATPDGQPPGDGDVALEITLRDGRRDLFIAADAENAQKTEPSSTAKSALVQPDWKVRLEGELCWLRRNSKGALERAIVCRAASLRAGQLTVKCASATGFFEFDLSAKKAKVVSGDPSQLLELKNY